MATRRILNWVIVAVVFVFVFMLASAGQAVGGGSGFDSGRQVGYAFGQALIAAIAVWFVLRWFARRNQRG